jgi:hypothetical protein
MFNVSHSFLMIGKEEEEEEEEEDSVCSWH